METPLEAPRSQTIDPFKISDHLIKRRMGLDAGGKPKAMRSASHKDRLHNLPPLISIDQVKLPDSWLITSAMPMVQKYDDKWTTSDLVKLIIVPSTSPKKSNTILKC
jgi:hypothetical protein